MLQYAPVYAAVTLIASDIGKVCLRLMEQDEKSAVWLEAKSNAFSPLLRRPNAFQTRQQFIECWMLSKLLQGNTYAFKVRDDRKVVKALYIAAPDRVTPLVSESGAVFYELRRDDLSRIPVDVIVPASEVIHDRMEPLFHPLVGISPLFAAHLAATQGTRIQNNSEVFFRNMSRPGGMLTAPEDIPDETAARLKTEFEKKYSGENIGRLFVGGSGLTFNPIAFHAEQAQLVEQLKVSGEQVATAFHVPGHMIGVAPLPASANVSAMTQDYYQRCLQKHYTAIEDLFDIDIGLADAGYRAEFDLEELYRMDAVAQTEMLTKASGGAYFTPNEARAKAGLLPVPGGDALYKQHQDHSVEALAKRDESDDPFGTKAKPAPQPAANDDEAAAQAKALAIAQAARREAELRAGELQAQKTAVEEQARAEREAVAEQVRAFIADAMDAVEKGVADAVGR